MVVEKDVDCFGLLWDPNLVPCNSRCAVAKECKEKCQLEIKKIGQPAFEKKQRSLILANEEELRQEKLISQQESRISGEPSQIVSEIINFCTSMGLKSVPRDSYVTFKHNNRSLFMISRVKSKRVEGLIRFVNVKEYAQFPREVIGSVSTEPKGGYFHTTVTDLDELKVTLSNYIKIFKEPNV